MVYRYLKISASNSETLIVKAFYKLQNTVSLTGTLTSAFV